MWQYSAIVTVNFLYVPCPLSAFQVQRSDLKRHWRASLFLLPPAPVVEGRSENLSLKFTTVSQRAGRGQVTPAKPADKNFGRMLQIIKVIPPSLFPPLALSLMLSVSPSTKVVLLLYCWLTSRKTEFVIYDYILYTFIVQVQRCCKILFFCVRISPRLQVSFGSTAAL